MTANESSGSPRETRLRRTLRAGSRALARLFGSADLPELPEELAPPLATALEEARATWVVLGMLASVTFVLGATHLTCDAYGLERPFITSLGLASGLLIEVLIACWITTVMLARQLRTTPSWRGLRSPSSVRETLRAQHPAPSPVRDGALGAAAFGLLVFALPPLVGIGARPPIDHPLGAVFAFGLDVAHALAGAPFVLALGGAYALALSPLRDSLARPNLELEHRAHVALARLAGLLAVALGLVTTLLASEAQAWTGWLLTAVLSLAALGLLLHARRTRAAHDALLRALHDGTHPTLELASLARAPDPYAPSLVAFDAEPPRHAVVERGDYRGSATVIGVVS